MARFLVTIGFMTTCTIEIDAHSASEAKEKALAEGWDYDTESTCEDEVLDVELMPGQISLFDAL